MRSSWMMIVSAIALAMASPIGADYVRPGSDINNANTGVQPVNVIGDVNANAGVQPGNGIAGGNFVNEERSAVTTAAPPAPATNFQNTAFSATDENRIVGDVSTGGSYRGTTMSAVTRAGDSASKKDDSTNTNTASSGTSTPGLLAAAAAACVVAVAAVAVVKKRAENKLSTPRTPEDDTIYYQVEPVVKPGHYQVNRQLTPPLQVL
ncbi:hypothetical protein PHYSODRAFT_251098 [Phytophthora sojae]|uniref:RxLR effector protein n=1 Tax=Phytophthora sojae (strain P6497) TaxID=1094619 RepID=G4ZN70_PHYSP|nr:hypothetical protein PHYSODRAFT_251098 [Phytophthora sojae]EGZ15393.1 hypothetical protein PHYSODRAFT_251098 [Phytophthora sojae]|eukprot:XP_009529142.1 hypothetical protein PHYSODRAFT_251098 [Phytophthora sojae]